MASRTGCESFGLSAPPGRFAYSKWSQELPRAIFRGEIEPDSVRQDARQCK